MEQAQTPSTTAPAQVHREKMVRRGIWLPESDIQQLQTFYPHYGSISKVIRLLVQRHISRMQNKTQEILGEKLTELDLTGLQP